MKEKSGRERYSQTLSPEQIIFVLEQTSSQSEAARQLNIDEIKLYRAVRYHKLVGQLKQAKARWKIQDEEDKVFRQQEVIGEIRRLAVYFKHTPTAKEFALAGLPVTRLIESFGSVNNATKAAGLIPNNHWPPPADLPPGFETQFDETVRKQIDERREARLLQAQTPERQKQIIRKILEVAIRVGHTPTAHELDEAGLFYYRLSVDFGSPEEAIRAAGLEPNHRWRTPNPLPDYLRNIDQPSNDKSTVRERASNLLRVKCIGYKLRNGIACQGRF